MTDKPIMMTLDLSEEDVQTARAAMRSMAEFPGEVAKLAARLEALAGNPANAQAEIARIAELLGTGSRFALDQSAVVWTILQRATLHQPKGGLQ